MAGPLLLVALMYLFSENKAQVPAPKLTVNPAVITEAGSVTLNCQTPTSSVSVSQCQFITVKGQTLGVLSCLKTLTGTELVNIVHQSLPAKVKVMCNYTAGQYQSTNSNTVSITINSLLPPTLTVNPAVITETDSVTLTCQTPSVNVPQCLFRLVREKTLKLFPCLKKLTGTELLKLVDQSSPAVVTVTCFYLSAYQSQESNMLSITIQPIQPKLTVNPAVITETDSVTLNCYTPSSVSVSQCYFYDVREQTYRVLPCLKTLTGTELLNMVHQSSPAKVEVKCFYTAESRGGQYQSPHSNISSITIQKQKEEGNTCSTSTSPPSHTSSITKNSSSPSSFTRNPTKTESSTKQSMTISTISTGPSPSWFTMDPTKTVSSTKQSMMTSTMSTDTGETAVAEISTLKTADKSMSPSSVDNTEARTVLRKLFVAVTGFGVTVGVISLGLVLLCTKRRREKCFYKRSQVNVTDDPMCMTDNVVYQRDLLPAENNEGYDLISSVPATDGHSGSGKLNSQILQNEDSDTHHLYCTISEEPVASTLYHTVQAH